MNLTIYLAAKFDSAPFIDGQVAAAVTVRGFVVRSTWHSPPHNGPERLDQLDPVAVRLIADRNDAELAGAGVVLALLDGGRETLCELRLATMLSIPVVAVSTSGSFPLSAYREGVTRCTTLGAAYDVLAGMAAERRAAS